MTNLTIYNGANSQQIALSGLADQSGNPVASATITATLSRAGVVLPGSTMTFAPVSGTPGNYTAMLSGFDVAPGSVQMLVSGTNSGSTFNVSVFVTIASRSF